MKTAFELSRVSAPSLSPSPAPDDLWSSLIDFAINLRGWWAEVCGTLELTPTQGLALRLLDPDSPMAMNALAETLACDASNVTGVVDKLEARGLIARQADENDRRVKMLVVTKEGRDLRRKLFAEAAKPPAAIAALPKDVRDKMGVALRAVRAERSAASGGGG
jgi:DNA-binding MarR family transcriptional regulator